MRLLRILTACFCAVLTSGLGIGKDFQIPVGGDQKEYKPKLQGPVIVNLNGTEYKLDTDVCTGGVMLKEKTPVLSFCGVGVFGLRRKGCSLENEMVVGVKDEYTCTSFPGGVQGIFVVDVGDERGTTQRVSTEVTTTRVDTTVVSTQTPTTSTSTQASTQTTTTSEASTTGYLTVVTLGDFEHNNLIEKRGVKDNDLVEEETTEGGGKDVPDDVFVGEGEGEEDAVGKRESKGKEKPTTAKPKGKPTVKGTEKTTGKSTDKPATGKPTEKTATGKPTGGTTKGTGKPDRTASTGKTTGKPESTTTEAGSEPPPEGSDEADTLQIEDEPSAGLSGRSGNEDLDRPYDVKPNFKMDSDTVAGNNTSGSGEDTLTIVTPAVPVIDSVLDGRGEEVEKEEVDFGGGSSEEMEFSAEEDERGGGWEEEKKEAVPEQGTIEYDILSGGIGKWVKLPSPSPLFDAHLTLLRKQIEFEIVHWGVHTEESSGGAQTVTHQSVVGLKELPTNTTWLKFLSEVATTASVLIPEELFRDSFSVPGSKPVKTGKGGGLTTPASNFFNDLLFIFGFFARSYEGVELPDEVVREVGKGFEVCRGKAMEFRKGVVVGEKTGGGDCVLGVEVKSVRVNAPVWDQANANFTFVEKVLEFKSSTELPPLHGRINPGRWVFAELMWYAAQVSYVFCFESFTRFNPNAFMAAFDVILRVFESQVVKNVWVGGGGNLGVFEMLLPYVKRGVGSGDFRGLLTNLDKVFGGVLAGGVVSGFGRGRGGRDGYSRNSWDEVKRRRRRDLKGFPTSGSVGEGSTVGSSGTESSTVGVGSGATSERTKGSTVGAAERLEKFFQSLKGFPTSRSVGEEGSSTTSVTEASSTVGVGSGGTSERPGVTLSQFEIWDGAAYCLVSDGGKVTPSFEDLEHVGVCRRA